MSILQSLKGAILLPVGHHVRLLVWYGNYMLRCWRFLWNKLLKQQQSSVYYGHRYIPHPGDLTHGGCIKFQRMQHVFPNTPGYFNLLYLVSSWIPGNWVQLLSVAHQKNAKFIWNQNGVAYPAWDSRWEQTNQPMAKLLHKADYVFYQSQFAKMSADHFLGERKDNYEILYNAVDTTLFSPARTDPAPHHLVILMGGTQNFYYRFASAVQTLAILLRHSTKVRLLIAGILKWGIDEKAVYQEAYELINEYRVSEHIAFLGAYTQQDAPTIFRQAHMLLHPQYNDVCPGLVIDAMACGLPVVYSQSGGMPELVGDDAGSSVPAESSWERIIPPSPKALAEAVLLVADRRKEFSEAARQRAVEKFDLRPWLERHKCVFESVLTQ